MFPTLGAVRSYPNALVYKSDTDKSFIRYIDPLPVYPHVNLNETAAPFSEFKPARNEKRFNQIVASCELTMPINIDHFGKVNFIFNSVKLPQDQLGEALQKALEERKSP